ncbi:YciI family protein [Peteryoungia ipomoeae]|uniref:GTP cyclohydrolase n=1 Tax=Peteryoungia ipomoeae TaxID=1210932 RepID=A0A4S8NX78_9HYPH|nr:YciI family protein [Peteryoungia ipomoeae]THV21521.1 GTP cyclohydrolase [Peteryoungia ipomoeae]
MFILSLTYVKPSEDADRLMQPHMDWVNAGYESGLFLASGRKNPRTGGVILAKGDRAAIETYAASDPFVIEGIAICDVTEVVVSRAAAGLEGLKD